MNEEIEGGDGESHSHRLNDFLISNPIGRNLNFPLFEVEPNPGTERHQIFILSLFLWKTELQRLFALSQVEI